MCNSSNCSHDDLDDDLDAIFGPLEGASDAPAFARAALAPATSTRTFEEDCDKCRGSGRFVGYTGRVLGACFTCKGTGKRRYKTSADDRAKMRERAAAKRHFAAVAAMEAADAWRAANPADAAWLDAKAGSFDFATSVRESLYKYGSLTEKQHASVTRLRLADEDRKAAAVARVENAPVVDITAIREGFAAAQTHLKRPKLRVADMQFSLAPASGNNAGCIYVARHSTDAYLGKITPDSRFVKVRDCDAETEAEVIRIASDPKAAAEAHGHEYGYCSCCGRELTNPESVARGIGPICAERWGW